MTWTFIWLMLLLKIPVGGMLWLVWWVIKNSDEQPVAPGEDDGGSKLRLGPHRQPRPIGPRRPRRGPHAGARPPAPARVRSVSAIARKVEHR
ncbi:MAG TPA: hypothetical protein VHX66_03625 [Solirubrobacteraceae bacterium]|jgi:hypothetical protein|nr:hypothetical protein [Solirubrobacteraceae bacterium]